MWTTGTCMHFTGFRLVDRNCYMNFSMVTTWLLIQYHMNTLRCSTKFSRNRKGSHVWCVWFDEVRLSTNKTVSLSHFMWHIYPSFSNGEIEIRHSFRSRPSWLLILKLLIPQYTLRCPTEFSENRKRSHMWFVWFHEVRLPTNRTVPLSHLYLLTSCYHSRQWWTWNPSQLYVAVSLVTPNP